MSVKVMTKVWESGLPSDEKFVALCLADFANDDGDSIFPSQEHIAWKCGKSDRAVRDTLQKLIKRGVMEATSGQGGGRGVSVHYRLHVAKLPQREPWNVERMKRRTKKSADSSGFAAPGYPRKRPTKTRKSATPNPEAHFRRSIKEPPVLDPPLQKRLHADFNEMAFKRSRLALN